jgi:hypothetical protein
LALLADAMILLYGPGANEIVRRAIDFDAVMPPYLGAIALIGLPVALYSAYGRSLGATRIAAWLDRVMMPVAYTASALLALFALLMWLR